MPAARPFMWRDLAGLIDTAFPFICADTWRGYLLKPAKRKRPRRRKSKKKKATRAKATAKIPEGKGGVAGKVLVDADDQVDELLAELAVPAPKWFDTAIGAVVSRPVLPG